MPYVMGLGVLPLGLRAGVALPVSVAPHLLFIPSTGLSLLGIAGPGAVGGTGGVNAGASAVLYAGRVGLKTSLTGHRFTAMRGTVWLFEVAVVGVPANLH
jgi:hypothetical protein